MYTRENAIQAIGKVLVILLENTLKNKELSIWEKLGNNYEFQYQPAIVKFSNESFYELGLACLPLFKAKDFNEKIKCVLNLHDPIRKCFTEHFTKLSPAEQKAQISPGVELKDLYEDNCDLIFFAKAADILTAKIVENNLNLYEKLNPINKKALKPVINDLAEHKMAENVSFISRAKVIHALSETKDYKKNFEITINTKSLMKGFELKQAQAELYAAFEIDYASLNADLYHKFKLFNFDLSEFGDTYKPMSVEPSSIKFRTHFYVLQMVTSWHCAYNYFLKAESEKKVGDAFLILERLKAEENSGFYQFLNVGYCMYLAKAQALLQEKLDKQIKNFADIDKKCKGDRNKIEKLRHIQTLFKLHPSANIKIESENKIDSSEEPNKKKTLSTGKTI